MKHTTTLLSLLLLVAFISCKKDDDQSIAVPVKPNILLVIADDVGIDANAGYPISAVKPSMPNLDALIAKGLVFDNAWANPVCSPTRATILTGKHGFRTGVLNASDAATIDQSETTLQSFIDQNTGEAYSHALFGKWHLSNQASAPEAMGIGSFAGVLRGAITDFNNWDYTIDGATTKSSEYCTSKLTNLAIDWIDEQQKPWFCWLAYTAAHTPLHLPPDSMHSQGTLPADDASISANPLPYYMAMVESIDYELGRLMNSMTAEERSKTIVIYIGDNGTSRQVLQQPYRPAHSKGSLYQGGVHVPLVISGNGVSRSGQRESSLVSSTDLFATIAELCGVNVGDYHDSHSFAPMLSNESANSRLVNYTEVISTADLSKSGYAIRNTRYKLIELDDGNSLFFDLEADAYESQNLLNRNLNSQQQAALDKLRVQADSIRK